MKRVFQPAPSDVVYWPHKKSWQRMVFQFVYFGITWDELQRLTEDAGYVFTHVVEYLKKGRAGGRQNPRTLSASWIPADR